MYRYDAVDAFKHGAIGHMIAKRFIQRLSSTGKWPRECSQPAGSKATSVPENLLAYQCVADGLQSDLTLNSSAAMWLPMHLHLTPWRQLFTIGCGIKDCRKRGLAVEGSCETAALLRLPSFADAFGCKLQRPDCNFARSNG
ncbi:uncharacterized protein LOC119392908 [Rhipicephalus sanguineus]|uniref:uncharacterized protein LOC119392908 n=1 Tax=Rhipicephalus sanguineus TaxID=34632 RepID=UPI001895DFB4|nr:uncharacterized protein LOC119392908 [Rhipicephalus sanguineus]